MRFLLALFRRETLPTWEVYDHDGNVIERVPARSMAEALMRTHYDNAAYARLQL